MQDEIDGNVYPIFPHDEDGLLRELRRVNRDLRGALSVIRRDRARGWELARYWHKAVRC